MTDAGPPVVGPVSEGGDGSRMQLIVEDRSQWMLPGQLRRRARELGDAPFLSFAVDDATATYREADERSDRLAAGLARLGVAKGDRVLVMLGNRLEFVLTWFALNKLGAFHAPINTDYRGDFLEHVANTAEARIMVVEDRHVETVLASRERLPLLEELIVVGEQPTADPRRFRVRPFAELPADDAPPAVAVTPADTYAVLFTSGTTGRSKGALMPYAHGHLLNERNLELLALDRDSTYISELPLFHINAHMTVYGSLIVGARARLEERFSASRWLERVRASGATHSSMLGVMVDFVMRQPPTDGDRDHDLRSVWMVPCTPELANRFRDRFGVERIVTSYGTSETGMVARRIVDRSDHASSGTVSPEFYDVQIVDADDEPLPAGEVGEIVVRTRLPWTVTHGYFGAPETTLHAMRNLWFHTGDAGRFDEDGNLWFVDRLADRIRRRGENVASADVEHVLAEHPWIAEVAVVAIPADEQGGEDEIKACVVLRPSGVLDAQALWAWCDERLPYFAVPRYVEVLDALPKTPTEKVVKQALRTGERQGALHDRGATGRAVTR
jgi:carnitine-CoA ligase